MSNIEKLKEYLVGSKGYLLNDNLSNGKVIMFSGEWGSGKTHFWKNEIEPKLDRSIYISLYGKKSISDIENEVLSKSFLSDFSDEDIKNIATFGNIAKNIVSIMAPKIGEKLEEAKTNLVNNFGKNALQNGGLLCFDDFERKSKDVDLNDLFGFITQLALTFKCKIVLILNSDVFEGKEKTVFTTAKEKTVSKYLMFNPTCEELFDIIFDDKDGRYKKLEKHKQALREIFSEVGIVNARIFIQVLDNWLEWVNKKDFQTDFYLRYFVLTNINFILNHHMFEAKLEKINKNAVEWNPSDVINADYYDQTGVYIKSDVEYKFISSYLSNTDKYNDKCIENTKKEIEIKEKDNGHDSGALLAFINRNESLIKSLHFMECFKINEHRESNNQSEVNILNEINNFIETGIL